MTQSTRKTTTLDARTLLGPSLGGAIETAFQCMEFAEEEIAAAKTRHPLDGDLIHRAFSVLCPSEPLRTAGEKLYRAHCQELIERIREGRDTRAATKAELIAVLSALSLQAPLDRSTSFLYWELFGALFPRAAETLREETGPVAADAFDKDQARELERKLSRRLAVPSRVFAKSGRSSAAA